VERERGLALVSVLWALSILSLIATSMMSTGTLSAAMERNALKRAQADRLAESAIALGILGLLDPRAERRWRVDGVAQDVSLQGIAIKIAIQDEFGLIDLNQAGADLFRGLFRSAGLSEREADQLGQRVIDWRTAGAGRERPTDYRNAGFPYVPRGAQFQSVDELKLVLGVTPELFARTKPALTVYSQQPDADQRVAPREALLALPNMDARRVEVMLRERTSVARGLSNQGPLLGPGVTDPALALSGHAFTITASFTYRETRMEKQAIIRLGDDPKLAYIVLELH
jgi:general secretion pathway protein K